MSKVMDLFRGRASVPGHTLPIEGAEKRKAVSGSQLLYELVKTTRYRWHHIVPETDLNSKKNQIRSFF